MATAAPSPVYLQGMPMGWNVQANGNEALTGNKPDTSYSGALTASGLLAESFDSNMVSGGTLISAAGVPTVSAIQLLTEQSVQALWYDITVAGATLTTGDCWAFLLNSSGALIGQSADQHTIWQTGGIGGSAGAGTALVASSTGSLSNLPAGVYFGGVVCTGTTAPTFASGGADVGLSNINTTVAAANFNAASLTPAVTTSASLVAASPFVLTSATLVSKRLWMGVN
jgi:hypothetical protein